MTFTDKGCDELIARAKAMRPNASEEEVNVTIYALNRAIEKWLMRQVLGPPPETDDE